MRQSFFSLAFVCAVLMAPYLLSAQPSTLPISTIAYTKDHGKEVTIEGTVLYNWENEVIFVMDKTDVMSVQLNEMDWDKNIQRGDRVRIEGTLQTQGVVKNEIDSSGVTKVGETNVRMEARRQLIKDILQQGTDKRIYAVVGKFDPGGNETMTINDSTGTIRVDVGSRFQQFRPATGASYVVIGRLDKAVMGGILEDAIIQPVSRYELQETDAREMSMAVAVEEKPLDEVIKVKGRLLYYIGKNQTPFLYDGEHVLIVKPADKFRSQKYRAGKNATVLGIYDTEMVDGEEYGVLRSARITPTN